MRKGLAVFLAVVLAAAFALPAMAAGLETTGFIRIKPYVTNLQNFTAGYANPQKDAPTNSFVDQRGRIKFAFGEENVKGIAFFELDQAWGDSAYTTGRNLGGGLEADTINLETKNLYIWFKVPNTGLDVSAGVQNQSDSYAGIIFGGADVAGIFANYKYDPVTIRLGWGKFWENLVSKADDVDFYVAEAKLSPMKDLNVGVSLYFLNDMGGGRKGPTSAVATDNAGDTLAGFGGRGAAATVTPAEIQAAGYRKLRVYMPGVNASFNLGPATLSGFFLYQTGTAEGGARDVDVSAFAADLRADVNVPMTGGKLFVEGLYTSGDDDKSAGNDEYKALITASNYNQSASYYTRGDMFILFPNGTNQTTDQALAYDMANGGAGVMAVTAGYSQKLMDKLTGKIGAGYLAATEKRARDQGTAANFANETAMAVEANAVLTYNIQKGLDFAVAGAYAWLGDGFKTATVDPDDLWDLHAHLQYAW